MVAGAEPPAMEPVEISLVPGVDVVVTAALWSMSDDAATPCTSTIVNALKSSKPLAVAFNHPPTTYVSPLATAAGSDELNVSVCAVLDSTVVSNAWLMLRKKAPAHWLVVHVLLLSVSVVLVPAEVARPNAPAGIDAAFCRHHKALSLPKDGLLRRRNADGQEPLTVSEKAVMVLLDRLAICVIARMVLPGNVASGNAAHMDSGVPNIISMSDGVGSSVTFWRIEPGI